MMLSTQPIILMIGGDGMLGYLIGRYAETSGYRLRAVPAAPAAVEVRALQPAAVLFPSVENLEASRGLVAELVNLDIPLLVCTPVAGEARARELGADYCLLHPLTYEQFLTALDAAAHSREA